MAVSIVPHSLPFKGRLSSKAKESALSASSALAVVMLLTQRTGPKTLDHSVAVETQDSITEMLTREVTMFRALLLGSKVVNLTG